MTEDEIRRLREDRDSWREVALALADLHRKVAEVVLEQKHVIKIDAPTLGHGIYKALLTHERRNPPPLR